MRAPRRDHELGAALRALPVPHRPPDFFERLAERLNEEAIVTNRPAAVLPRSSYWRAHIGVPRWVAAVAAAAVVAAAAAVVVRAVPAASPEVATVTADDVRAIVLGPGDVPEGFQQIADFRGRGGAISRLVSIGTADRFVDLRVSSTHTAHQRLGEPQVTRITSEAHGFADIGSAREAFELLAAAIPTEFQPASGTVDVPTPQVPDVATIEGPALGDELIAFQGNVDNTLPGTQQTLYLWRIRNTVLLVYGTNVDEDVLRDAAALMTERAG